MYKTHPSFKEPSDDKVLWRYMDMAKYVSLISTRQLFFCKADRFEDPFEGKLNNITKSVLQEWYVDEIPKDKRTKEDIAQSLKQLNDYLSSTEKLRPFITISSWHQNDNENFAMWKIYSNWNSGLAIVTNFERAKQSFKLVDESVNGGMVKYIQEERDIVNPGNIFNHFMTKRSQFAYENEVRFIHQIQEENVDKKELIDKSNGVYIDVDLEILIDKIYVAPQAESWVKDAVIDLNDKYGIKVEVRQSSFFSSEHYT